MSWDTEVIEKPCYCGEGTLVLTLRSDDWNRSEQSGETRCARCSKEYEFKTWEKPDGDTAFGWVKRLTPEEARRRAREQDERLQRETLKLNTLRERHGRALVEVVSRFTSKKALWAFLQKSRLTTSLIWSFAAFNRLVIARGRSAAITELITPQTEAAVRALLKQSK